MLAAGAPAGRYIEIGTSAGYSTLWLAMTCEELGRKITTFEILPDKAKIARETFRVAQLDDTITLIEGDARNHLPELTSIAFCFLDCDKELYGECYEMVVPKLMKGGFLVADNAINLSAALKPMIDIALQDERVDSLVVPIGKGELVCRKL
jgi:caffeoyl-CoA O-methyltransferase